MQEELPVRQVDPTKEPDKYKKLTAQNVSWVATHCLYGQKFNDNDVPEDAILQDGIRYSYGFAKDKLEDCRPIIEAWLDQLHPNFHAGTGGGYSFLAAGETIDGNLWGEHIDVERMMVLGIAIGRIKYCFDDRSLWEVMPGGMPYFMITDPDGAPEFPLSSAPEEA